MTGYVRKDTSNNIADGNIINAADLDAEFDGVVDAFNAATGHKHDGTTGEGAPITVVGPTQDVVVSAAAVTPKTTNAVDIGSSSLKFKDIFITGTAALPTVNATTVDTTNIEVTNIKAKDGTASATIADSTGVMTIASAILTTADINGGTLDNVTIGGSTAAAASVTTLTTSSTVTHNGGTANGVAYLNASKVLTSGSALTFDGSVFTAVGADGALGIVSKSTSGGIALLPYLDSTNGAKLAAYNAAISAFSHLTIDGTYLRFNTSNAEQMRLTSTGLGIGTSSPARLLDVNGDAAINGIRVGKGANSGTSNTVVGVTGLNSITTGDYNTGVGANALRYVTSGNDNTSIGNFALRGTTTGSDNVGVGSWAGYGVTTGSDNVAIGFYSIGLGATATGSNNVAIGDRTLNVLTSGYSNSALGSSALNAITTGYQNAAVGSGSGSAITTGYKNSILGSFTGNQSGLDIRTSNNYIVLSDGDGNPRQVIDSSGNVGIGTSSPGARLDVAGTYNGTQATFGFTSGRGLLIGTALNGGTNEGSTVLNARGAGVGQFLFQTDGVTRATLDSSGNLGLGVTPSAWTSTSKAFQIGTIGFLENNSNVSQYIGRNGYRANAGWTYSTSSFAQLFGMEADGAFKWFTAPSGTAGAAITFTQAMTLDASGRLGIGLTNPAYRLDVAISSGPYSARFNNSSTSTSQYNVVVIGQGAAGSAVGYFGTGGSAVGNAAFQNTFVVGTQTASSLVFNTTDTERARIDSSGNFGIGTSSPGARLDVNGGNANTEVRFNHADNVAGRTVTIRMASTQNASYTGAGAYIQAIQGAGVDVYSLAFGTTQGSTSASERMRLDSFGNLGLGVTPSAWSVGKAIQIGTNLALWDDASSSVRLMANAYYNAGFLYKNTAAATSYQQAAGEHYWFTAPSGTAGNPISFTRAMTLDASGNLGLGVASPGSNYKADVLISTASTNYGFQIRTFDSGSGDGTTTARVLRVVNSNAGNWANAQYDAWAHIWTNAGTERARIDSSGNLLMAGTAGSTGRITINQVSQLVYSQGLSFYYGASSYWNIVNGAGSRLYFGFTNLDRAYVDSSSGSWNAISDRRAKKNIAPIEYGLTEVLALNPVTYNMLEDEDGHNKRLGFIAQEVKEVMDEAVDASDDPSRMLGLDKSVIVPVLVKAIQEQQAIIEQLKADVAALKGAA